MKEHSITVVILLINLRNLNPFMSKHQTNLNRGTFYKLRGL